MLNIKVYPEEDWRKPQLAKKNTEAQLRFAHPEGHLNKL